VVSSLRARPGIGGAMKALELPIHFGMEVGSFRGKIASVVGSEISEGTKGPCRLAGSRR
jgi:hypothetical protein